MKELNELIANLEKKVKNGQASNQEKETLANLKIHRALRE